MWDRRVLFMLFTVLFTTPHSAHADIEGTTRIRCYDRNTPVDCGQPTRADGVLAGSGIEGSFLEALIDAAQLLNGIYEAVAAIIAQNYPEAGYRLYESYQEAMQLGDSAADKQAVEKVWIKLDQGAPFTRVTLTFEVQSDEDPLWPIKVAVPPVRYTLDPGVPDDGGRITRPASAVPPLSAVVVDGIVLNSTKRQGTATVSLYPKRMPMGSWYPIVFSVKEDDCSICLGIIHVLRVSTYKDCRLIPKMACDIYAKEFENTILKINAAYGQAYQLMEELVKGDRARQRYCGPPGQLVDPLGNPRPQGCDDQAEERYNPGSCPEYAAGLSRQTCDAVRPIFEDIIRPLQARQEQLAQQIVQEDCCNPYVNPTGRNRGGTPGIDLNVTSPHGHGHGETPPPNEPRHNR